MRRTLQWQSGCAQGWPGSCKELLEHCSPPLRGHGVERLERTSQWDWNPPGSRTGWGLCCDIAVAAAQSLEEERADSETSVWLLCEDTSVRWLGSELTGLRACQEQQQQRATMLENLKRVRPSLESLAVIAQCVIHVQRNAHMAHGALDLCSLTHRAEMYRNIIKDIYPASKYPTFASFSCLDHFTF